MKNIVQYVRKNSKIFMILSLIFTVIFSLFIFFYCNSGTLGLTNDSIAYLSVANSIKEGNGLLSLTNGGIFQTVYHYAPGTSVVLSAFPLDIMFSFYILNTVAYALSVLIVFSLLYKSTKSFIISSVFSLLWSLSPHTIAVFSHSWSEPLFILLSLIVAMLWLKYFEKKQLKFLLTLILITSILPLIRYAGLFLIPITLILIILVVKRSTSIVKNIGVLIASGITLVLPYLLWSLYLKDLGLESRVMDFDLIHASTVKDMFAYLLTFFVDVSNKNYGVIFSLLFILSYFILFPMNKISQKSVFTLLFSSIYVLMYLIFLVVSISLFDHATPFDYRIAAIITPFIIIILGIFFEKYNSLIMKFILFCFISLLIYLNIPIYNLKHSNYYSLAHPKYDSLRVTELAKDKDNGIITNAFLKVYAKTYNPIARWEDPRKDLAKYWSDLDIYLRDKKNIYLSIVDFPRKPEKYIPISMYEDKFILEEIFRNDIEVIYLIKLK